jgi:hypothetical protein
MPKFGDTVLNRAASEGNPQRTGTFVREIRRSGRLNPGVWWQITDGQGSFWETPPAIAEVQPAPDIARAAQVQILREIQGQIGEGDDVYDVGMVIHRKLAELDAALARRGGRTVTAPGHDVPSSAPQRKAP